MTIEYRLMREEDAEKVVELYRAVYGDKYPIKSVYDPKAITESQNSGDFYRFLAFDGDRVVGQIAAYRSASPNPRLYEEGQGIVLSEYRNQGILEKVWRFAHETVHPEIGLDQLWGEGVCNHVFTQKVGEKLGFIYTGIELDLMPAAAYEKEKSSAGRVSSLLGFKVKDPVIREVHVPDVYNRTIPFLFDGLGLERRFVAARAPLSGTTRATEEIYEAAAVARFTFTEPGRDFEDCLLRQETAAVSRGCTVFHAFLDLTHPATPEAVSILRRHRYFLGGVLPCWFGGDGILMQKLLHEPDVESIKLHGERARQVLAMVLEDRESVG